MVFVWVPHHPLHGGVVVLHLPATPCSGRSGGGGAQERPGAPQVNPAASGSAANGGHWQHPPVPDAGAAGREAWRGGETGCVGRGCHDGEILAALRCRERDGGRYTAGGGRESCRSYWNGSPSHQVADFGRTGATFIIYLLILLVHINLSMGSPGRVCLSRPGLGLN